MTLSIPLRLPSLANMRGHWSQKARVVKTQRQTVTVYLGGKPRPPFPVTVALTRIAPRKLDVDNGVSSLKAVQDAVAAWLGVDDADPRVTWAYAQRAGGAKVYAVEVVIVARSAA